MLMQLDPTIPVRTPMGAGIAHFLADISEEYSTMWGVFDTATGQFWWWPTERIRAQRNISLGRHDPEHPK